MLACWSKSVSFGNLQSPQNLYMHNVCTEENAFKVSSSFSGFGGSFGGLQGKDSGGYSG